MLVLLVHSVLSPFLFHLHPQPFCPIVYTLLPSFCPIVYPHPSFCPIVYPHPFCPIDPCTSFLLSYSVPTSFLSHSALVPSFCPIVYPCTSFLLSYRYPHTTFCFIIHLHTLWYCLSTCIHSKLDEGQPGVYCFNIVGNFRWVQVSLMEWPASTKAPFTCTYPGYFNLDLNLGSHKQLLTRFSS